MRASEKLEQLRQRMQREGMDLYFIPTSDPHMNEYVMQRYQSRVYLTGFTGSAGYAVVTADEALLWADGRYHVQAAKQIKGTSFTLMKWGLEGVPTWQEWLKAHEDSIRKIGVNGQICSQSLLRELQETLPTAEVDCSKDLVGEFWENRPDLPGGKAFVLEEIYTGETPLKRMQKVRKAMQEKEATHLFLSTLDDICYLMNIRGSDDAYTPIVVSYLMIDDKDATLFVDPAKIDDTVGGYLRKNAVRIRPYGEIASALASLPKSARVWAHPSKTSALHYAMLSHVDSVVEDMLPTTMMKAVKNETEIENAKRAHIIDGAAVSRFLCWVEQSVAQGGLNEFNAAEKLHALRSEHEDFLTESFATISAYGPNAAMAHYSASSDDYASIEPKGLYLVDSGGQYRTGTTDITRTIAVGQPTAEEIRDYTLTLKGHIDLFLAKFQKGTSGNELDILARGPMYKEGIDFKHGTGHGVGFVLGVHEGPQSISRHPIRTPLVPGMIVSNEPGIYREGKHGIRIENLVYVEPFRQTEFGTFYGFSNLTFVPYDRKLIDVRMLTEEERAYIDVYHAETAKLLSSLMKTDAERQWLKENTAPLSDV